MSFENVKEILCVLIADDSEEDSFFLERALRQSHRVHVIASVRHADETIAYLAGQGAYADRQLWPFPHVLLMDFKATHKGGEVLEWLKNHPETNLKVVQFSGSSVENEINRVKSLGPNALVANMPEHAQLIALVAQLEKFLLNH